MEEIVLPTISDMYKCTRENHDYQVIRKYQPLYKNFAVGCKPTKRSHYLDQTIRLLSSPGPANKANHQQQWTKKTPFQSKRAQKATFLDQIGKKQKKLNFPSPNHYQVSMPWPKQQDKPKNISEKINFTDTSQYESDKTPGPGNYNISTHPAVTKDDRKWIPHRPLKERDIVAAQVDTYKPCPLEYNTFARYQRFKKTSQTSLKKSSQINLKKCKQNQSPGPATYSTVCFWEGKGPSKKNQSNYFNHISKSPSAGVYHA